MFTSLQTVPFSDLSSSQRHSCLQRMVFSSVDLVSFFLGNSPVISDIDTMAFAPAKVFQNQSSVSAAKALAEYLHRIVVSRHKQENNILVAIYTHGDTNSFYLERNDKKEKLIQRIDLCEFIRHLRFRDSAVMFLGCRCLSDPDAVLSASEERNLSVSGAYFVRTFSGTLAGWSTYDKSEKIDPLASVLRYSRRHLTPSYFDSLYYVHRPVSIIRRSDVSRKRGRSDTLYMTDGMRRDVEQVISDVFGQNTAHPIINDIGKYYDLSLSDRLAMQRLTANRSMEFSLSRMLLSSTSLVRVLDGKEEPDQENTPGKYVEELAKWLVQAHRDILGHFRESMLDVDATVNRWREDAGGELVMRITSPSYSNTVKHLHLTHKRLALSLLIPDCTPSSVEDIIGDFEGYEMIPRSLTTTWMFVPSLGGPPHIQSLMKQGGWTLGDLLDWYNFDAETAINGYVVLVGDLYILINACVNRGVFTPDRARAILNEFNREMNKSTWVSS